MLSVEVSLAFFLGVGAVAAISLASMSLFCAPLLVEQPIVRTDEKRPKG